MRTRTFVQAEALVVSLLLALAGLYVVGAANPPPYVWLALVGLAAVVAVEWTLTPVTAHWRNAREPERAVESFFVDDEGKKRAFPSLVADPGTVSLSVVSPAFNEEKRLPRMLDETIGYLEKRRALDSGFSWEILIVDDGSRDATADVVLSFSKKFGSERVRLVRLAKNHGKGGAVMKGMLRARGKEILMIDADGATRFSDLERLEEALRRLYTVNPEGGAVFGSRFHMQQADAEHKREPLRGFVSFVFHLLVTTLVPGGVRDTQCGFKLFSRAAARRIFPRQKIWGWSFDCELLFLAGDLPVTEVAVFWVDVPGSKLSVVLASLEMARDIVLLRLLYGLGLWR